MASNPVPRGGEAPNSTAIPIIQNIFGVSSDFLGQLRTWLEQNPPAIPVTQIIGFSQFSVQPATTISTNESTSSTSYGALTTPGPVLSGLPDGKYVFLFGANAVMTAAGQGLMVLKINSVAPVDADSLQTQSTASTSLARAIVSTLSGGGNNTVTAQYRVSASTCTFGSRWLIALRIANA